MHSLLLFKKKKKRKEKKKIKHRHFLMLIGDQIKSGSRSV